MERGFEGSVVPAVLRVGAMVFAVDKVVPSPVGNHLDMVEMAEL